MITLAIPMARAQPTRRQSESRVTACGLRNQIRRVCAAGTILIQEFRARAQDRSVVDLNRRRRDGRAADLTRRSPVPLTVGVNRSATSVKKPAGVCSRPTSDQPMTLGMVSVSVELA